MVHVPIERHLVRGRDLADRRYADPTLTVDDMAAAAGLSRAHFTREFRRVFGETPRGHLLTRRMERAASLLRHTDYSVAQVCLEVGLQSVGSFTSTFTRHFGTSPTRYRADAPPAQVYARIPACVMRVHGRPQHRTFGEDGADPRA